MTTPTVQKPPTVEPAKASCRSTRNAFREGTAGVEFAALANIVEAVAASRELGSPIMHQRTRGWCYTIELVLCIRRTAPYCPNPLVRQDWWSSNGQQERKINSGLATFAADENADGPCGCRPIRRSPDLVLLGLLMSIENYNLLSKGYCFEKDLIKLNCDMSFLHICILRLKIEKLLLSDEQLVILILPFLVGLHCYIRFRLIVQCDWYAIRKDMRVIFRDRNLNVPCGLIRRLRRNARPKTAARETKTVCG